MTLKPVENIKADVRDILDTGRRILNRHLSSIRGYTSGVGRGGLLRR